MSVRARQVLDWIDALERREGLIGLLGWEDVIAEPRLAPDTVLLIGPPPRLPDFAELLGREELRLHVEPYRERGVGESPIPTHLRRRP